MDLHSAFYALIPPLHSYDRFGELECVIGMMFEREKKQERLLNWAAGAECYEQLLLLSGYFRVESYIYTKSVALIAEYIRGIYYLLQNVLPWDKEREQFTRADEASRNLSLLLTKKADSQILNSLRNLYSLKSKDRRAWSNSTAFLSTQQHCPVTNEEFKYCNLTKLHRWIAGSTQDSKAKKVRTHEAISNCPPFRLPSCLRQYVNTPDILGWTPLHYAVSTNSKRAEYWVQLLMEEGANINVTDIRGYTPLHHSLMHDWLWFTSTLIERGAHVKAVSVDGMTPLHLAASSRHYVNLGDLLFNPRQPADQFAVDNLGRAPVHLAALTGTNDAIEQLRVSIGARDKEGRTALHLAAFSGHWDIVAVLVRYGANLDESAGAGDSLLHWAVVQEDFEAVDELLRLGATVSVTDRNGWTPLHIASFLNEKDIARPLIQNGADVNATAEINETPIMMAISRGSVKVVDLLLKIPNIELEHRSRRYLHSNCTALGMAVTEGNIDIVRKLVIKGTTIDSQILRLAEERKEEESIAQLIRQFYLLETCVREHVQGLGADMVWGVLKRALLERDQEYLPWDLFAGATGTSFCFL